jgi:hypothetical protein
MINKFGVIRLGALALSVIGILGAQDPPTRVGRLSWVGGSVSFQPGGVDDWVAATVNRPLTTGDQIFSDINGRAEVRVPGAAFRLGTTTALEFLNLDDRTVQLRLSEGAINVTVRRLDDNQVLEIDTPNLAFSILRPGEYRIDTDPNSVQTTVAVRAGQGEITGNGEAFNVQPGQQAVVSGQDQPQYNVYAAAPLDDFDRWGEARDQREARLASARFVSPYVVGYEDLDDNGTWQSSPDYGQVWIPRGVPADWAPYHYGHWAWIDPWGWSWVDDASWGFAPFHYGRWASYQGGWAWVPGPVAVTPVYAPALVAWVGFGGGNGAGISFGGDTGVGWFALGPRDVYIPAYRASETYVTRVNTSNAVVINNTQVTNVYNVYTRTGAISNVTYSNRAVAGAVMAVPQSALTSARPVHEVAVKVQPNQLASIKENAAAPHVAPQVASVMGRPAASARVARPSAAILSRPMIAKSTPPPAPAPFQQRQAVLAKDPGRPMPIQQQQQMNRAAPPPAARPAVKVVTAAKQITPQVAATPAPRPGAAPQRPPNAPAPAAQQPRPPVPAQSAPPARAAEPPRPQSTPTPIARPQTPPPATAPEARPAAPAPAPAARPQAPPPPAARPAEPPRQQAAPAPAPRPQAAPPPPAARPQAPPPAARPQTPPPAKAQPAPAKSDKDKKDTKKEEH